MPVVDRGPSPHAPPTGGAPAQQQAAVYSASPQFSTRELGEIASLFDVGSDGSASSTSGYNDSGSNYNDSGSNFNESGSGYDAGLYDAEGLDDDEDLFDANEGDDLPNGVFGLEEANYEVVNFRGDRLSAERLDDDAAVRQRRRSEDGNEDARVDSPRQNGRSESASRTTGSNDSSSRTNSSNSADGSDSGDSEERPAWFSQHAAPHEFWTAPDGAVNVSVDVSVDVKPEVSRPEADAPMRPALPAVAADVPASPRSDDETRVKVPKREGCDDRERNREHARNMRQRKKEALADLLFKVDALTARLADRQRTIHSAELATQDLGRRRRATVLKFGELRSKPELDVAPWAMILADGFRLIQPRTPHRYFSPAEILDSRRVTTGAAGMVDDCASCAVFFQSIARRVGGASALYGAQAKIPRYAFSATLASVDASDDAACVATYGGNDCVGMHWEMRTIDAVHFGAVHEAGEQGLLVAKFVSGSCKLLEVEMTFDVINAMQEVEATLPLPWLATIPHTLSDSTFESHYEARVVTSGKAPFAIVDVNRAWLDQCGFSAKYDCIGHTLKCIQGPDTDFAAINIMVSEIKAGRPAEAIVYNYTKHGRKFLNYIRAFPLFGDAYAKAPSHCLGIVSEVADATDKRRALGALGGAARRDVRMAVR
ncbi:hypothetical protein M885DRAFT_511181 [Pelagophyceae sp. CCMP2097]|nr:hypothetical protein M885DRAFT_511181 [Pelagophyceae sp. CCMP2097]